MYIQSVLDNLTKNYPHQPEFLQAVNGDIEINRGIRIQFNSALDPYI